MATYIVQEEPGISDLTIKQIDRDQAIPVAIVTKGANPDFPFDRRLLAENMVDLLNNQPPRHNISGFGPHQFYYQRLPNGRGIDMHCQYGCRGISESGVTFILSDKSNTLGERNAMLERLTPEFMKKLCDAIDVQRLETDTAPTPAKDRDIKPSAP